ncbi:MAG: carboxypeptidase-like regulatory domain-containing protein, partial [Methanomicrobiales archaeon]|nr:carboxypeptidase-like regulatory domain-containing protein [Methanomicrobiales archaeon]
MLLLCSAAQATTLQITVQDSRDNTTIPYATIFVNGANYAKTNNLGQATLDHAGVSDQLIRVASSGYTDWEKTVAKNQTSILVNLSRKTLDLKVSLFDSDTLSPVTGARVNITGTDFSDGKISSADGVSVFEVLSNKVYTLEIRADNYQPRTEIIDMGAENRDVQYWLLSGNRFSIVVKDQDTSLP